MGDRVPPSSSTRGRPRGLLAALLALACLPGLPACATVESPPPRPWQPAEDLPGTTSARALAADLGGTLHEEPEIRGLVIEGSAGRILFLDGSRTVIVDGKRMEAGATLRVADGDVRILDEDAVRISRLWRDAVAAREAKARALASRPEPPPPPASSGNAVGDPEWNVPLQRKWEGILIHHSATDSGNLEKFDKFHRENNGWLMVGYDFIICNGSGGPDGLIQMSDRWRTQIQGAHAGPGPTYKRYNDHWVGICLVGDFSRERPTAKQMASLRRLVRYLQDRCGIADGNVRTHKDVRDTECPGKHFPLREVLRGAPRAR